MCTADGTHAGGDAFGVAGGHACSSAPQALTVADAAMLWPLTPIGTLVTVIGQIGRAHV